MTWVICSGVYRCQNCSKISGNPEAAKGCKNVIMITLGTGVGGGIILGGKILAGAHGAAGEIGKSDPLKCCLGQGGICEIGKCFRIYI